MLVAAPFVPALADLAPTVRRSLCPYGCLPEDIEAGGIDAVCPDCARKYGMGDPLTYDDACRLIELPLNARLEDVVGGLDERAAAHRRIQVKRGLLATADQNLLHVDEVNLLPDILVDALLDQSAGDRAGAGAELDHRTIRVNVDILRHGAGEQLA